MPKKPQVKKKLCEAQMLHTKCPKGYTQRYFWAEEMYRNGYRQIRCPKCGLYEIWVRGNKKLRVSEYKFLSP